METNIIMLPQEQLRGFKLGSMATSALSPEDKVKCIGMTGGDTSSRLGHL